MSPISSVSAWLDMMTQVVTVEAPTGQDVANVKTYGPPVTYPCRLVGKRRQVVNSAGVVVASDQTCYLGTDQAVDPESRITLSTDDVYSTADSAIHPPILAVGRYPDENGAHHSVIYLLVLLAAMLWVGIQA